MPTRRRNLWMTGVRIRCGYTTGMNVYRHGDLFWTNDEIACKYCIAENVDVTRCSGAATAADEEKVEHVGIETLLAGGMPVQRGNIIVGYSTLIIATSTGTLTGSAVRVRYVCDEQFSRSVICKIPVRVLAFHGWQPGGLK